MKTQNKKGIPLRVLCLEDSTQDAELTKEMLSDAGYELQFDVIEKEKEYVTCLESGNYDIILSDYSLPGFNGMQALEIAMKICPEIPFISISGTAGEEIAVEMLKKGAVDYIIKDRIKRLPFAVEGALKKKEAKAATRKAEEALKTSESKYSDLYENAPDMFISMEAVTGTIIKCNKTVTEITNYSKDEITGLSIFELYHPDCLREAKKAFTQFNTTGELRNVELQMRKKDGSKIDISTNATAVRDESGRILYSRSVLRDITERKRAEEKIRLLAHTIKSISEIISITDLEDKFTFVNQALSDKYGYSYDEIIGQHVNILRSPNNPPELLEDVLKHSRKDSWKGELQNLTKDGREFPISLKTSKIVNENGDILGLFGIAEDITERKRVVQELIDAKEKAEEMSRLKSNFLANMSHEIRTPLSGILGFSDIIQDENNLEAVKKMAEIINDSGNRLLNSLNQILDLSSLESNTKKVNYKLIDINYIIKETIVLFSVTADKKNLKLKIEFDINTLMAYTDTDLISKTLNNLINNAIIYTNRGSVTVRAKEEIINEKECIVINVIDTGIGIEKKNLEIIFDEFRQVSEGWGRSFEGNGLGLSLCKKYMNLIGGSISVTSELGKGSDFRLVIPKNILKDDKDIKTQEKSSVETTQPDSLQIKSGIKPKILYIEDDPECIKLVKYIVTNKYDIAAVTSGAEGIEKTKNNEYALILLDINLSKGISGLEVLSEIRKIPYYKDIPVIALTAFAMAGDEEEFRAGGCEDYISKPFKKEMLLEKISKALNG